MPISQSSMKAEIKLQPIRWQMSIEGLKYQDKEYEKSIL